MNTIRPMHALLALLAGSCLTRAPESPASPDTNETSSRPRAPESPATTSPDTNETSSRPRAPERGRTYCERFPDRCDHETCSPVEIDPSTGATIGGCSPISWVCCGPGGCVAVGLASDCVGGSDLYWSDCEAGESAVDPDTGLAIVICHD